CLCSALAGLFQRLAVKPEGGTGLAWSHEVGKAAASGEADSKRPPLRRPRLGAMRAGLLGRPAALAMGRSLVRVRACQCDQKAATELMRILVAAIHEDYEAELLGRDEPDIGRRIVETTGFVHDDDPVVVLDLPGHCLRV